jgi:hypothetical protein
VLSAAAPLFSIFQGVCNSVLGQSAESVIPDASSTCSRINAKAGIAQSAEGVTYVLMAGADGLNLGRELLSSSTEGRA